MSRTARSGPALATVALLASLAMAARAHTWRPKRPVGFTERVRIGVLGELAFDERPAVSVRGATPRYLRGRTLGVYREGTWSPASLPVEPVSGRAGRATHRAAIHRGPGVFLPLGARVVGAAPGTLARRSDGTYVARGEVREIGFRIEEGSLEAPAAGDLELPRGLGAELRARARALVGSGARSPRAVAERLRRALIEEKSYRLDFTPEPGRDPVIDFLDRAEGGHCEIFASAYVLLARSVGIPARFVSGYLASERDGAGTRARLSDAHAWAEVHVDGRYWTVDPTPPQRSKTTSM